MGENSNALQERVDEVTDGKIGRPEGETIIDIAVRERGKIEDKIKELQKISDGIDHKLAEAAMGGRSFGGVVKPKTQAEIDFDEAKKIADRFTHPR